MDLSSSSTYASHKITVSGFVLTHSFKRIGTAENGFKKTLGTLFVTRSCLFGWSKLTVVLSTVRFWGIGAGSCKCLHSSSTRHAALRLRPISVSTVDSLEGEK